jgi:hypothetical protein
VTPSEWKAIRHFSPNEFTDPAAIQPSIVSEIDRWRALTGLSTLIISSTGGEHLKDSQHYLGLAVDCMVIERPPGYTLMDQFFSIARFGFTGIGIYPETRYTNTKGQVIRGSFHLDTRELAHGEHRALWIGVKVDGVNKYLPMSEANLRAFGGIKS